MPASTAITSPTQSATAFCIGLSWGLPRAMGLLCEVAPASIKSGREQTDNIRAMRVEVQLCEINLTNIMTPAINNMGGAKRRFRPAESFEWRTSPGRVFNVSSDDSVDEHLRRMGWVVLCWGTESTGRHALTVMPGDGYS